MSKEKAVESGNFYYFPEPPIFSNVKPGRYYPGYSSNKGFILSKNHVNTDNDDKEVAQKSGQGMEYSKDFLPSFSYSSGDAEEKRFEMADQSDVEIFEEDFDKNKYFCMEKYNSSLAEVDDNINKFIENKDFFTKNKLDYKRSVLLFSVPGTGKTWYITNKCEKLIAEKDAVVINIENSGHLDCLSTGMGVIDQVLSHRLKVIVIEELAEFCKHSELKTKTLQLMDSPFFKNNMLFLVTTNEPESIPANLIDRPSRLDLLSHIDIDSYSEDFIPAWYKHNTGKDWDPNTEKTKWFKEAKQMLTPVYWSELFKFSELQQIGLKESWGKIQERKKLIKNSFADQNKKVGFS